MKIIIRSIWILTLVIGLISLYWVLSRYTDLFVDELLEKGKWGNVSPVTTFVLSVISILILTITLRFYNLISSTIDLSKSLKMAFFLSIFFILIATMFWSDSWTETPSPVLDSRELGDAIWKLGHPLTFLIIDLPIYLRRKFDGLNPYWSDFWAYPSVLILFNIQFAIYIHGIRMLINLRKIKTTYNNVYDS